MQQSKNFVKGTALWKIGRVGLDIAGILAAFIGFLMLPTNDLGLLTRSLPIARELGEHGHMITFCCPESLP